MIILVPFFTLDLIINFISKSNSINLKIIYNDLAILIIFNFVIYLLFFIQYLSMKKITKGKIHIDENGITDYNEKVIITIEKQNIKSLIIGKEIILISYDCNIIVFLPINVKSKVIKAFKEKLPEVKIIDRRQK